MQPGSGGLKTLQAQAAEAEKMASVLDDRGKALSFAADADGPGVMIIAYQACSAIFLRKWHSFRPPSSQPQNLARMLPPESLEFDLQGRVSSDQQTVRIKCGDIKSEESSEAHAKGQLTIRLLSLQHVVNLLAPTLTPQPALV